MWQMANQGPKLGECRSFPPPRRPRGRPELRRQPLHRRGQPPLRRAQQSPRRPAMSRGQRIHHRRHDLLSVDHQLTRCQGQDIEEFKYVKRWAEEIAKRPAVQKGHGGRRKPLHRRDQAAARGAGPHPQDALQPARHSGEGDLASAVSPWICEVSLSKSNRVRLR